ncbi:MAG: FadR family transcriptional regulator [Lachnospiraceae bacterium]|nr:FadR family transcriptional regulator [Lachnospiraceae bacterium]
MYSKQTNAETLKEGIVELIIKHLKSGEKLPSEKEMMQAFNVSRTSLREVLSAYEANGILESRQGSGYYVQTPNISKQILNTWSILLHATPNLFLDLLEIRRILEIHSLPRAIERIRTEQLQHLSQQVEAMKAKAQRGEAFVAEDRQFHRILFESTNNVFLEQLLTTFWDLFEQFEVYKQHDNLIEVAGQHEKILKAFAKQDLSLLDELFQEQFNDSRYQVMKSLLNL